jgi:hypothetical protein
MTRRHVEGLEAVERGKIADGHGHSIVFLLGHFRKTGSFPFNAHGIPGMKARQWVQIE